MQEGPVPRSWGGAFCRSAPSGGRTCERTPPMSLLLPLVTVRVTQDHAVPSNAYTNTTTTMIRMIARTVLTLATVLLLGQAQASGPNSPLPPARTALERALDRQLNKYLTFPVMAPTDMTGEVTVSFVVNADGRIEVI